jgi:hypothetical protein
MVLHPLPARVMTATILRAAGCVPDILECLTTQFGYRILPCRVLIELGAIARSCWQRLIDEGTKQRKAWLDSFNNDRELGGANRGESARLAQLGLEKMGIGKDHPFRATLTETGFGNHPDMIRILRWVGSTAAQRGSGGARNVPAWKALYPDG